MTLRAFRLGEPHPSPSPLTLPVACPWISEASKPSWIFDEVGRGPSRVTRQRRRHGHARPARPSLPRGEKRVCHAPFRARAMVWPKRLDSIGAIPTSRCEWLASWVRVIEPARPRTSSLGSDSPSSQDSDATSVEPRTTVHDGPAFPRRTTCPDTPDDATRCVSSNPATDSRNRAPAGCSAPGGSHTRTRPRRGASASGPVARARNLALPDLPRCASPGLALRLVRDRASGPASLLRGHPLAS